MMPSGHKAFLVNNVADVDLLLMHNATFAAEYVHQVSRRSSKALTAPQDRPRCISTKAHRNHRQGEADRCQGYQRQGPR